MEKTHVTITKKDLAVHFGLLSKSGKTIYYKKLRRDFFTDQVLNELGITAAEYNALKGGRPFSFQQSQKIKLLFELN